MKYSAKTEHSFVISVEELKELVARMIESDHGIAVTKDEITFNVSGGYDRYDTAFNGVTVKATRPTEGTKK